MSERKTSMLGVTVTLQDRYAEEHACNSAEADVLNQVVAQNIGNNVREDIRKLMGIETPEGEKPLMPTQAQIEEHSAGVQALVDEYAKDYTLASGGRRVIRDPVERIAWRMAKEHLDDYIRDNGHKRSEIPEEEYVAEREKLAAHKDVVAAAKEELERNQARKLPKINLGATAS